MPKKGFVLNRPTKPNPLNPKPLPYSADEEEPETADVSFLFLFVSLFLYLLIFIYSQVVYCRLHKLFSLIHGKKSFEIETYTRAEMLAVGLEEVELADAQKGLCPQPTN